MSSTINPAMQSVAMSYMPQEQNTVSQQEDNELAQQSAPETTASGSDTVTLSSGQAPTGVDDYRDLVASQTVNQSSAAENENVSRDNQVRDNQNITNSASLQAQANFAAQQTDQISQADMS